MNDIRITENRKRADGVMMDLAGVAGLIKSDAKVQGICEYLRGHNLTAEESDEIKSGLKCAEFHSVCEGIHSRENFVRYTGYMCFDLDDSDADYRSVRAAMAADGVLRPVLMFTSPRGKLKVVLRVPQCIETPDTVGPEDWWKHVYRCVSTYISYTYSIMPDQQCNDITRVCYLSHDDDPYYDAAEPATEVPVAEWGDEGAAFEFGAECEDKDAGIKSGTGRRMGSFERDRYYTWLEDIRTGLRRASDGDWDYDRSHRVFVGSRSRGTAELEVGGYRGYPLKRHISSFAMWLYEGDTVRAQAFVDNCFEDSYARDRGWNRCVRAHLNYPPAKDVVLWILKEFSFNRIGGLPSTTMEFVGGMIHGGSAPVTVAARWDEICREHGIPRFFRHFMADTTVSEAERDLRLYSAIATVSGFAKNQLVQYNHRACSPNLILNVVGGASSGKGAMGYAPSVLLPSLDNACREDYAGEKTRYCNELAEYKKDMEDYRKSSGSASAPPKMPKKPVYLLNCITLSTVNGLVEVLKGNNGKLVVMNTEYSNIARMEKSQYGGMVSNFKNIFDNDAIGTVSAKDVKDMGVSIIPHPCCSGLFSGTFGQFHDLYRSFEDGLLSRSLYYIVPDKRFELAEQGSAFPSAGGSDREAELEFLQWHVRCLFTAGVKYYLSDSSFNRLKTFMDGFVNKLHETYGGGDSVGYAMRALFNRFPHNVVKTATILQSFADFEEWNWNQNYSGSPRAYIETPKLWYKRGGFSGETEEEAIYKFRDYTELQDGNTNVLGFGEERDMYDTWLKHGSPCEYREIGYNFVEAAVKILTPSLLYGIQMFESYRTEDTVVKDVNPVRGKLKYLALDLCPDEFGFTDYRNALCRLRGRDVSNSSVNNYIRQLCGDVEHRVEKLGRGCYKKI
ncbi:MAG: DUF3987 domain-containing protein [Bacteroidales bacterium]|nr:DUF3987 domain-containing protein [Bacteroidales bacterium]MBR4637033.1 DUF3987 domain-containing protein [Bacteroidales bacterium]